MGSDNVEEEYERKELVMIISRILEPILHLPNRTQLLQTVEILKL